jgi:hypothetical protein
MAGEPGNIRRAIPQLREFDAQWVDAIKKIQAKITATHPGFQVLMGGADHPDIDRDLFFSADALKGSRRSIFSHKSSDILESSSRTRSHH